MQTEQTETHLGKQVLIGLIDAGLILILFWQYTKYMAELSNFGIAIYPVHPIFIIAIAFIFYRFICLLLMNGTIGMKIFRVVYLNADEEPLSF